MGMNIKVHELKKCEGGYEDALRSVETVAKQIGGSTGYKPGRAAYEDGIYHVSLQKGGEEVAVYAPHDGGEWELWDYDSNEDPRLIVHAADPDTLVRKATDVLKRPQSKRTAVDYDNNKGESKKNEDGAAEDIFEERKDKVAERLEHLEAIVESFQPTEKEADQAKISILDYIMMSLDGVIGDVEAKMGLKKGKA